MAESSQVPFDLRLMGLGIMLQGIPWIFVAGKIPFSDVGIVLMAISMLPRLLRNGMTISYSDDRNALVVIMSAAIGVSAIASSVFWTPLVDTAAKLFARDMLVVMVMAYLYLTLREIEHRTVIRLIGNAIFAGAVLFTIAAFISMAQQGKNIAEIYRGAILSGDPNAVQAQFFNRLFNPDGSYEKAQGRHTIFLLFSAGAILIWFRMQSLPSHAAKGLLLTQLAFLVLWVIASLSRQACLIIAIFSAAVVVCGRISAWASLSLVTISVLAVTAAIVSPAGDLARAKFVDDVINNPRITQHSETLDTIRRGGIYGVGSGVTVYGSQDDYYAHNLLVHSIHQSGVIGFVGAVMAFLSLAFFIMREVIKALLNHDSGLRIAGTACIVLATIPMSRYMFGVRGSLEMASALSMTLALLIERDTRIKGRLRTVSVFDEDDEDEGTDKMDEDYAVDNRVTSLFSQ